MASPFKWFRKHQKWLIVSLFLMAMIAFVFLSNVQQYSGGGVSKNPVVVATTEFGDLRSYDLQALRHQRQLVLKFLGLIRDAVLRSKLETNRDADQKDKVPIEATVVEAIQQAIGPATEQSVVDTWLYAQHAKRLGLVVGNQAVSDFIREMSENRVHASELKKRSVRGSREQGIFERVGVGPMQMYELLRHELLALRLRRMFYVSLEGTTPAQRWDYFNRLERRATIEVIPVAVANYVGKVQEEPAEEELRELFEKYREQYANPVLPEPGFRKPHKIGVRYFKADLETFASEAVTEDEVKSHYEKNKDRYRQAESAAEERTAKQKEEAEKPGEQEATGDADAEKLEQGAPPARESKDSGGTSSAGPPSPFVLVSLLQEEAAGQGGGERKGPPVEKQEPAAGSELPNPETEPTEDSPNAAEEAKEPVPEPVQTPADKPDAEAEQAETPDEGGDQVEKDDEPEDPLKGSVGRLIRQELAHQKVSEVFDILKAKMKQYQDSYVLYEVNRESNPSAKPPKELDFEALARQYRLGSDSMGVPDPVSPLDAGKFDIGRSYVGINRRFTDFAYDEGWLLHKAATSLDLQGNRYLFWKVMDEKEEIPKFEDPGVRGQVLEAWKVREARKLALQEAANLAETARKAGKSLKDSFVNRPDFKVTLTPPFSWMTNPMVPTGMTRAQPRMSDVTGVEMAGPDFMRTVFDLDKGKIGVAMNAPQSIVYVVRVVEFNKSDTTLWEEFTADLTTGRYGTYAAAAIDDQIQIVRAWQRELETAAGLEWQRKADQRRRE